MISSKVLFVFLVLKVFSMESYLISPSLKKFNLKEFQSNDVSESKLISDQKTFDLVKGYLREIQKAATIPRNIDVKGFNMRKYYTFKDPSRKDLLKERDSSLKAEEPMHIEKLCYEAENAIVTECSDASNKTIACMKHNRIVPCEDFTPEEVLVELCVIKEPTVYITACDNPSIDLCSNSPIEKSKQMQKQKNIPTDCFRVQGIFKVCPQECNFGTIYKITDSTEYGPNQHGLMKRYAKKDQTIMTHKEL